MASLSDPQEHHQFNFQTSHDATAATTDLEVNNTSTSPTIIDKTIFPILSLPLELRLKIYTYILPPRHHKIVTSIPPTNFFYNTSLFPDSTNYPFGHFVPPSSSGTPLSVTYAILTSNTHTSYPHSSITAALLRTCKQIQSEAEPVLYGSSDAVWDFGVHLEAIRGFWGERSKVARSCVRGLRVAWEVPVWGPFEGGGGGEMLGRKTAVWLRFVEFVKREMGGLRGLDLMLWCADGGMSGFPRAEERVSMEGEVIRSTSRSGMTNRDEMEMLEKRTGFEMEQKWREWKWTNDLFAMLSLRQIKVTCWSGIPPNTDDVVDFGATVPKFDSWVAGRMVADSSLREKMVKDGIVVREEATILGSTANWFRFQTTGVVERQAGT